MDGIWEDFVTLNSAEEVQFEVLPCVSKLADNTSVEIDGSCHNAYESDIYPLPQTKDREGYYGNDHSAYWWSGQYDAEYLLAEAARHGVKVESFLDLGCASGRVIRHIALAGVKNTMGCDINRHHVEWCNKYLSGLVCVFQNHSIPSLPLADASVDMVSAFSVFTHIESLETAWLMEINRVLKSGGLAWVTVHTEHTLTDMDETWPLWKPIMDHPDRDEFLDDSRQFSGDRLVVRWRADRSYSSNVFYKLEYLKVVWGQFFEVVEVKRRFPVYQDVFILRKR